MLATGTPSDGEGTPSDGGGTGTISMGRGTGKEHCLMVRVRGHRLMVGNAPAVNVSTTEAQNILHSTGTPLRGTGILSNFYCLVMKDAGTLTLP